MTQRIHIVGCGPRSGTTLMAELMIACYEIDAHNEHESSIFTWPPSNCALFLTKRPRDITNVGPILRIMRNLWVIYLLRDPRDMIVSKHGKDPDKYWSGLRFWRRYTPYGTALQAHPRFISVRYEDLVQKPDEIQALITRRMPFLKERHPFSEYHTIAKPSDNSLQALGGVRRVSADSIGRWKSHLPRVAGQISIHGSLTPDLIKYGYEIDSTWESILENVTPDLSPSFWPERDTAERSYRISFKDRLKAVLLVLSHRRPFLSVLQRLRGFYSVFSGHRGQ